MGTMEDIPSQEYKALVDQAIADIQKIAEAVKSKNITPNEGLLKTINTTTILMTINPEHTLQIVAFNFLDALYPHKS